MSEVAMNESYLKGKWNEFKGKIQEEWGELTNDDVDKAEGNRDQLVGAIQQRYGLAKERAEEQISSWESRHGLR